MLPKNAFDVTEMKTKLAFDSKTVFFIWDLVKEKNEEKKCGVYIKQKKKKKTEKVCDQLALVNEISKYLHILVSYLKCLQINILRTGSPAISQ